MLEHVGCEIESFDHRSPNSEREIVELITKVIQDEVVDQAKAATTFGILLGDMTEITCKEKIILFIQYYCWKDEKVKTKFLSVQKVFEESESCSANAKTLFEVLCSNLENLGLEIAKVGGIASDGAFSVRLGCNNGVATKLKAVLPTVIVIYCVCHLETFRIFQYENGGLYQSSAESLRLTTPPRKTAKKLKRARKTRWLSTDSAVKAAVENFPAIIQTLLKLEDNCATSDGLLRHMNSAKYLAHSIF